MPHSGGGGRHGGGHHGRSHHSRGRSGGSSLRTSRTRFAGSRRYVYYRRNNLQPQYIYSNANLSAPPSKARYFMLVGYIPFIIAICIMLSSVYTKPERLKACSDGGVLIDDRIGALGDTSELKSALYPIYTESGISPAVMTVYNEEWQNNYNSLEDFAYSVYVNRFADEQHYLLVYSRPANSNSSFVDWSYEFMMGDDTDSIISESKQSEINEEMYKNLTSDSKYTAVEAIIKTFRYMENGLMDSHWNFEVLGIALPMLAIILVHCYFMIFCDPRKKYQGAVECAEGQSECKCTYCQGVYVMGTCTVCPHCGASVSTENEQFWDF